MNTKMSLNAAWSIAVGGMVGGGIFSVLGVVVETAGAWAWLSFLVAGVIALISAHAYSQLSIKHREAGGAFLYLRQIGQHGPAGALQIAPVLARGEPPVADPQHPVQRPVPQLVVDLADHGRVGCVPGPGPHPHRDALLRDGQPDHRLRPIGSVILGLAVPAEGVVVLGLYWRSQISDVSE